MITIRKLVRPIIIVLVMTAIYAFHHLEAGDNLSRCMDCERCAYFCLPYPNYITLQNQETLDLNWPGRALAFLLGSLQPSGWTHTVGILCVAMMWSLGLAWRERLRRGDRLGENWRALRVALAGVAMLCAGLFVAFLFMTGDTQSRRSSMTTIAVIPCVAIAVAALTEAGHSSIFKRREFAVSLALLLAGFYGWFDNAAHLERVHYPFYVAVEESDSSEISLDLYSIAPHASVADSGLALHFPVAAAVFLAELVFPALGSPAWLVARIGIAFIYWYAMISLLTGRRTLWRILESGKLRPALTVARLGFASLGVLELLLWPYKDYHGASFPALTFAVGAYIAFRAMRPSNAAPNEI